MVIYHQIVSLCIFLRACPSFCGSTLYNRGRGDGGPGPLLSSEEWFWICGRSLICVPPKVGKILITLTFWRPTAVRGVRVGPVSRRSGSGRTPPVSRDALELSTRGTANYARLTHSYIVDYEKGVSTSDRRFLLIVCNTNNYVYYQCIVRGGERPRKYYYLGKVLSCR